MTITKKVEYTKCSINGET